MSFIRMTCRTAAIVAVVTAALHAQQPQPAPAQGMDHAQMERMHHGPGRMAHGTMMGHEGTAGPAHVAAMAAGPAAHLLVMRQELGLTDEQVRKLEGLRTAQQQALEPPVAAGLRARADLFDATRGDGDLAAAKRAMDRLAQLRVDAAMAHLKARQEARGVLTADQKAKVDALVRQHHGRGGAVRGGGRRGPGMGHGMGNGMGPGMGRGMGGRRGLMPPPGAPIPPDDDLDLSGDLDLDLDGDVDLPPR